MAIFAVTGCVAEDVWAAQMGYVVNKGTTLYKYIVCLLPRHVMSVGQDGGLTCHESRDDCCFQEPTGQHLPSDAHHDSHVVSNRQQLNRGLRNTAWWALLAGCARGDHLQAGQSDIPLSSRPGTLVPWQPPHHHSLWHCFSASYSIFDCWSDGPELAAWRAQRSDLWLWHF